MSFLREEKRIVITLPILFEDDSVIVVDKPTGVVVNRSASSPKDTVQDWAEEKLTVSLDPETEFGSRGGIVHRLDKDTSGILVIAKNPQAFELLKEQFKGRTTEKTYLALVHGRVEPNIGKVDAPIDRSPFNRMHFGVFPGGREAQTIYKVQQYFPSYSLLEVSPKTGRTHQIRVHMKYLGYPLVADPIYGGRKQSIADLKTFPRLFLHAWKLKIKLPSGEEKEFLSPLPKDLEQSLGLLKDAQ